MRILVAEDNVSFTRRLELLLRSWGYDPLCVHDGDAALRVLLAPDTPRLVVLDWGIPGPDGLEVCRRVRESEGGGYTYIILLTGRSGHSELIRGLEAGADEYLTKPIDQHELRARLNAGRRIVTLQQQLLNAQEALRQQATRDGLTGLHNRVALLEILERETARSRRGEGPLGLVLADVDHFKRVNDTHGHLAGDAVLRETAQRLLTALRPYDAVGRYGGEEFLAILPGCDSMAAEALAERLRLIVASRPVALGGMDLPVTLSLGVASAAREADGLALIAAADAALYQAKAAGRNRVVVALPPGRQTCSA